MVIITIFDDGMILCLTTMPFYKQILIESFFLLFFVNKTLNMQFEETNDNQDNYGRDSRYTRRTCII